MRARHWMQIAAVASAIGLGGTAIAHDLDRTSSDGGNDNAAAQLDTPRSTMIDENAAAQLDTTQSTSDENAAAQLDTTPSTTGASVSGTAAGTAPAYGTTQGSTMTSPQSRDLRSGTSGAVTGAGSAATSIGGDDRLGTTNSENFNQWMSDYAAQHNGRITRQQFLDEMGNRWDVVDAQRSGYLTPGEVREIFIFENASPARSGSDVQSGDMGPANSRGQ